MLTLDHVAVLGETLEEAAQHVEEVLGLPMLPGGRHPLFATHNRLLSLKPGLYVEAIAIDPSAPPPPGPRWFGLDGFYGPARLDKWICRVPDLDAALAVLPMAGRPIALERGDLRWRMAVPEDGRLPFDGLFPALIEWQVAVAPGQSMEGTALAELDALEILHPEADALAALLAPHLRAPHVCFRTAPEPGLVARIAGPSGLRQLA